ncbi:tetratricopeptide repeat protein [Xanthomonas albilineans]|uniref:tetratricopeptide repeat protein n=2 Tax=Xanthomonas albilineans TaxID=29447 RepID=UPI0005F30474|nr:tetratricopeptide repeat protein [Xanthomonas albilineans]PPU94924.1 tetratricopeptide repeat protein [Xanthomonas albilineans]
MLSWQMSSIAVVLAALVFAAVLWPLRGDRRSRALLAVAVLALSAATAALYALIGTPKALQAQQRQAPRTLEEGIAQLQTALRKDPARADGWALLGRSQRALGRHAEAAAAFARAVSLAPDQAPILIEAAQARALADPQRRFDDKALAWLQKALQVAPNSERAAWFLGIAQRQRGQNGAAAATWQTLLPRVDAETAEALRPQIDTARAAAGLPALPTTAIAGTKRVTGSTTPAAATLTVVVSVEPDVAASMRLRKDASLFVIARVPGGSPMPVAVQKQPLGALPLRVTLSDADRPMPTQTLSQLRQVEVVARLSASGDAKRQDGDMESAAVIVTLPTSAPVQLRIGKH